MEAARTGAPGAMGTGATAGDGDLPGEDL